MAQADAMEAVGAAVGALEDAHHLEGEEHLAESALPHPDSVHYGMSRTAQLAISRGMAESIPGSGVTVNAVLPGPTTSG